MRAISRSTARAAPWLDRPMERFGSLQDVRETAEHDYILKSEAKAT
jgi:hypothetical protein